MAFDRPPTLAPAAAALRAHNIPGRPPPVGVPATPGRSQPMQRFGGDERFEIDPAQIGLLSSGGLPLPQAVRAKMEAAFQADFSGVRIHVGPQASRIGAIAFTTGNDLYFAPGQFQPDSIKGQQLIGHELAHVIQQRQGRVRAPGLGLPGARVTVVQDRTLEAEADRLGMRAAAHRSDAASGAAIQRKAGPPASAPRIQPPAPPRNGRHRVSAQAVGRQLGSLPVLSGHHTAAPIQRKSVGLVPPIVPRRGRVIQRMEMDEDYSDSDQGYSEDSGMEEDEEVLIANSGFILQWRAGVNAGYQAGWDQAIVDEAAQANPVITAIAARGMVGLPPGVAIAALQLAPPQEYIIDEAEEATQHGEHFGYGAGYQAGAAAAFRICGWLRGNYPAIPVGLRNAALAQNGGNCVYCNAAASTQVDHVYPIQKHWVTIGYTGAALANVNVASNLVGSCGPCNAAKSNTYLNLWNPPGWALGAWFPFGPPPGTIPARRGAALTPATW